MSDLVQHARWIVEQFVSGQMEVELFAQSLGGAYVDARENPADEAANRLATQLMDTYAQFSGGYLGREDLVRELARHLS